MTGKKHFYVNNGCDGIDIMATRVRVMVFNVAFNNISVISCGQFYW